MKVKIKKLHPDAVIPKYAKIGDAGMDLTAVSKTYDSEGNVAYGTGLSFEIPEGYVGLIFPRSSICKLSISLSNAVGIIDSGYRGEVTFKFKPAGAFFGERDADTEEYEWIAFGKSFPNDHDVHLDYAVGDRIGQIIILPYPKIEFEEVLELSETERGEKGYGSTGK